MSESRRTKFSISFDGVDITKNITPYFLNMTYTDNEDGEADDLQIKLQDRDGLWLESWLDEAVRAAAGAKLKISADITPIGWYGQTGSMKTGVLELDSVQADGPPSTVTIKATSLGFSTSLRNTTRSRAWENCSLPDIAADIAANGGIKLSYEATRSPAYSRMEQNEQSDIAFLSQLCKDAGFSLKCVDGTLVIFDQVDYEAVPPAMTIRKGAKGGYISYRLKSGSASTQYDTCRVSYLDAATGRCIEGIAFRDGYGSDAQEENRLEITARVSSIAEAEALAAQKLRLYNKFERMAEFQLPGNLLLVAGSTVLLDGWGGWGGKYMISQAKHSINASGWTVTVRLRPVGKRE